MFNNQFFQLNRVQSTISLGGKMHAKRNGAIWSRLMRIAVAVMVMLGMSLGVTSASGDEGVIETPAITATVTATAEPTDDSVIEVPEVEATEVDSAAKGKKPETKPTSTATVEPTEDPTEDPTEEPTQAPTDDPTVEPTEDPTEDPTVEPTEDPTEEPDVPTAGDLLVQCISGGKLKLTNNHASWLASVIAGYADASGTEVPLTPTIQLTAGETHYEDVSRVPSGSVVSYWTIWYDLSDPNAEIVENGGSVKCGKPSVTPPPKPTTPPTPEPTPAPQPTTPPTPEPTPAPQPTTPPTPEPTPTAEPTASVDPTPTQTVKPTPTESAKPSPTSTKSAEPKLSKAPAKPSGKSDDRVGPPSTGVSDDGNAVAAFAGLVIVITTAVAAMTRQRRKN